MGGGGVSKHQFLKESMALIWNFQGGGEVLFKQPSMVRVWIFSGTTHLMQRPTP